MLDYDWKPTEEMMAHFMQFCDTTSQTHVLAQVLDPMSHHKREDIMRPQPPKVAALYAIRNGIVMELNRKAGLDKALDKRSQDRQAEDEHHEQSCKWCIQGSVFDFVQKDDGRWHLEELGPCSKCSDGAWLPRPELVAAAKEAGCAIRDLLFPLLMSVVIHSFTGDGKPHDLLEAIRIATKKLNRRHHAKAKNTKQPR